MPNYLKDILEGKKTLKQAQEEYGKTILNIRNIFAKVMDNVTEGEKDIVIDETYYRTFRKEYEEELKYVDYEDMIALLKADDRRAYEREDRVKVEERNITNGLFIRKLAKE